MLSVTRNAI